MKEVLSNAMKMYDAIRVIRNILERYHVFSNVLTTYYVDTASDIRFTTSEGTFIIQFITYDNFQIFDKKQLDDGITSECEYVDVDGIYNLISIIKLLARELDI